MLLLGEEDGDPEGLADGLLEGSDVLGEEEGLADGDEDGELDGDLEGSDVDGEAPHSNLPLIASHFD